MGYCTACGEKSSDDSLFCIKCGIKLASQNSNSSFEQHIENFAEDVEKFGKNVTKQAKHVAQSAEDFGNRIEHKIDTADRRIEQWYERQFGVVGPMISSFIALIVLRLVIEAFEKSGISVPVLGTISTVLFTYLLLLFAAILLSSYTEYCSRKYSWFRWVAPVLSGICVAVFIWVAVQILFSLANDLGIESVLKIALFLEQYLPMIVVFVILFGYVMVLVKVTSEKHTK